ncbi:menaquinone-specific isochorismate synthase [Microbacterium sp. SORGH_AS 505]|uniref:isochorismate synthase n=1 Tax=Microbacterium sp. SORGH_AS_0505 TaxID=3041770 RepID=UPI0027888BB3|nr:isochorismate synthase [Microbacterium sp. SORGH_AS_0505]MDQ1126612.1 menaquinone-specific isochorismate synthase [Microbacterium sp. SORGH_AS_0505]
MTSSALGIPRLRAVTRRIEPVDEPLVYASPDDPTVWSRRGDLLVGVGRAAELPAGAPAAQWWRDVAAAAEIDDKVRMPGSGLVAFGTLPFDPANTSASAALAVPRMIIGRRGDTSWVTHVFVEGEPEREEPQAVTLGPHWSATVGPGACTPDGYQGEVRAGLEAIASGEVAKVVLARDLVGTVPAGSDLRRLVRALASAYPDTWTFAVDGTIGASPETLVTVSGGTVTARVLAGTAARGADADADTAASVALATSPKDLDEHRYAVQSVLTSLREHTTALVAEPEPFMLKLPNVWHLATDVEGSLSGHASSLDLVEVLHPTAAVAGTPTQAALEVIRRVEPFDRGRYAGPVGWIDAAGDGEWAIALRCAQFDVHTNAGADIPLIAHAGAGIVAGSDPETEMLETRVKFRPIVDALA